MKAIIFFLLLSLSLSPLFAQYDDIYRGVQRSHKGYYDEAIADLEKGLKDLSVLSERDKAKAYTYLAIAYLHAGTDGSMKGKFNKPLLRSLTAMNKAEAADTEKSYQQNISSMKPLLQIALYNEAAIAYNDKKYTSCQSHAEASVLLDETDHTAIALLGLALLAQNKEKEAAPQLEKAITAFLSSNKKANAEIAAAFTQTAALRLKKGDAQGAQQLAQQGLSRLQAYPDAMSGLTMVDLIAYEKSPNPLSRGREAFEAAIKAYPKKLDIQRTYAALLIAQGDEKDQAKGYGIFQQIQMRYPDDYEANAYLANMHVKEAQQIQQKLDPSLGDKQYLEIEKQVIAQLAKAYPFVKKAYDKQPDDPQWLQQLVSISTYVPAYQAEKGKWENALNNL